MITRRGVGFVLAAVAVFFVASATRVGWVHIADAFLWGVVLVSAVIPWVAAWGLRADRRVIVHGKDGLAGPQAGDPVRITVGLNSRKAIPGFMLSARYAVLGAAGGTSQHRFFFSFVPGRGARQAHGDFSFTRRGRVDLGRVTLECGAPFGLFRRRKSFEKTRSLLIYPRWHHMSRLGLLDASRGDSEGRVRARTGSDLAGSRRYVSSDPRRHMHWRNTARTGRLMVKEFDAWSDRTFVLAFGGQWGSPAAGDTPFEHAVRIAASVSRPMFADGGQVFIASAGRLSPSFTTWQQLMAELAVIEPGQDLLVPRAVPAGARVLAVICADDLASASALTAFARQGIPVAAVVVDRFDPPAPASGTVAMLRSSGVAAVACERGGTEEAVRAAEQGLFVARSPISSQRTPAAHPKPRAEREVAAA